MLFTVAWFLWNPAGWTFEWEPVVAFTLTLASFIAADLHDSSSVIGEAKKQGHPNDVTLAWKLLEALPSNGIIKFLKEHDFLGSFRSEEIRPLNQFLYEWDNPEHEFLDSELESYRKALLKRAGEFSMNVAKYTSSNMAGMQAVIVDGQRNDFEQMQRFEVEAKAVNEAADSLVGAHESFVRAARGKLNLAKA